MVVPGELAALSGQHRVGQVQHKKSLWQLPQQQVDSDLTVQAQGHLSRLSMNIQGTAETHSGP